MKFLMVLVLAFNASAFCATVGEFPFDMFNDTDIEDNFTSTEAMVSTIMELDTGEVDINTETVKDIVSTEKDQVWTPETSPIFKVIRDFLFQARDGLLEPLEQMTDGPNDDKTEQIIKAIEQGLIEATTILMNQMESATFPTVPSSTVDKSHTPFVKRKGEVPPPEVAQEKVNVQITGTKSKRQTAFDMVANMSTSCSDCYDNLQMCVQKCFSHHNCNDIQRSARACPPTPSRLCNPFTPWNPVDECKSNSECSSPLLCCNDGCINKCVPGVWRS